MARAGGVLALAQDEARDSAAIEFRELTVASIFIAAVLVETWSPDEHGSVAQNYRIES